MPGHLAEGFGAAHVQRRGRAEVGEPCGAGRESGVQVQGVGQVDLGLHPHGALEGHLTGVYVDVPAVVGGLPAAPGLLGHEPDDRLLHQPVHPAGPDPVREPRDLVVHEPRRRRTRTRWSPGRSGGPATPAAHRTRPSPRSWEPVPQLEGLTEVGLAGLGGQPDRGRELGHTELRDQRGTGTGDRDRGVAEPDRVTDRLRRVQVRPGAGSTEPVASAASATARRSGRARAPGGGPQRCRGLVGSPGSWADSVEQVFESRGWNQSTFGEGT